MLGELNSELIDEVDQLVALNNLPSKNGIVAELLSVAVHDDYM